MRTIAPSLEGALISLVVASSACGSNSAVPGPQSPSLQQFPPTLRETQPFGLRVFGYHLPQIFLGVCAGTDGSLRHVRCIEGGRPANLETHADLIHTGFRYYQNLESLDTNATGSVAVGAKAGAKITRSKHRLVLEWAKWRNDDLPPDAPSAAAGSAGPWSSSQGKPLVIGAEIGIAVRVVFDIDLQSETADAALSFGFGQLAAALASNRAVVTVQYDIVGASGYDLLPKAPILSLQSVNDLVNAENTFYAGISALSSAWNEAVLSKEKLSQFSFGVLAYYVAGEIAESTKATPGPAVLKARRGD